VEEQRQLSADGNTVGGEKSTPSGTLHSTLASIVTAALVRENRARRRRKMVFEFGRNAG
jgi:hypothetical protein